MDRRLPSSMAQLSNDELLARVKQLASREREVTVALIAHLAELDSRRLYLAEGCSSLFVYCTQVLHLSEHAAYGRIAAARAARKFPVVLEMLGEGSVNLSTICLLGPHLTRENHRELLDSASHKAKRRVEELAARLRPQPLVPASVRRLPTVSHASPPPVELHAPADSASTGGRQEAALRALLSVPAPPSTSPAVVAPIAPERYKIQFTANAETYEKLRLAQDLLRHQVPDGDIGQIMDRALRALLQDLARRKLAATDRPRESRGTTKGSRHIPAAVKREVWIRDGGRCAFVSRNGRRCTERGFLEFHHVVPHAAGSEPTAGNIQLRCRSHNGHEAEQYFGWRQHSVVRESRASYSFRTEYRLMAPSQFGSRWVKRSGWSRSEATFGPGISYLGATCGRIPRQRASTSC